MKMKLIRILSTGSEYVMPLSRYDDLPCLRIQDGAPRDTAFTWHELAYMVDIGEAEIVGEVTLTFTLERTK